MRLIADIRFSFEFIIPSPDVDHLRTFMGHVKREAEVDFEDTVVEYSFIKRDVCCTQQDVLMITWTIKDISLSDKDDRDLYREVVRYELSSIVSYYTPLLIEERIL